MTTRLERPLKREIEIEGKAFTLTIDGAGLKLVEKGRRNGQWLSWKAIANGDAAISSSLNASLDR